MINCRPYNLKAQGKVERSRCLLRQKIYTMIWYNRKKQEPIWLRAYSTTWRVWTTTKKKN